MNKQFKKYHRVRIEYTQGEIKLSNCEVKDVNSNNPIVPGKIRNSLNGGYFVDTGDKSKIEFFEGVLRRYAMEMAIKEFNEYKKNYEKYISAISESIEKDVLERINK